MNYATSKLFAKGTKESNTDRPLAFLSSSSGMKFPFISRDQKVKRFGNNNNYSLTHCENNASRLYYACMIIFPPYCIKFIICKYLIDFTAYFILKSVIIDI